MNNSLTAADSLAGAHALACMIMRRDEHRLPRAAAVRSFASALVCVDSLNFLLFKMRKLKRNGFGM